ncbi:MAG: hypothetical protein DCC65_03845 [Planctomycetota bacterium]|nr:MAG: hypothetical protein DCC65_03845 [Planctomycetota bacterium]
MLCPTELRARGKVVYAISYPRRSGSESRPAAVIGRLGADPGGNRPGPGIYNLPAGFDLPCFRVCVAKSEEPMTRTFPRPSVRKIVSLLILAAAAVLILPSAARAEDDPREFQKLERQLRREYGAANYEAALTTAEKMHALRPDSADTMYNIACLHCLMGKKDKAYEWLEKAVAGGYRDADHLQSDADFRVIWGEDRFRGIVRRIREDISGSPDKARTPQTGEKPKPAASDNGLTPAEHRQKIQALTEKMIAAADKKNYKEALKLAQEAHDHAEKAENPAALALTKYNLACMHSLLKEKEKALDYLEASVAAGSFATDMAAQIEGDGDLDFIRDDPRYKKILGKARASGGATRVEPQTKVTLPKKYNKAKAAPLLVVLHPWGGDMNETAARWQPVADKLGAILLTPQGTYRLPDGHYRWDTDLDLVEHNVLEAVESVMDQYKVDEDRVAVAGFSQGAWAAFGLAVRNPDLFTALIAIGGHFDKSLEAEADGEDLSDLVVVIMHGEEDEEEVLESARVAEKFFRKMDCDVTVKEYAGVGHEYPENAAEELSKAMKHAWD